jgi:SnoaL-like domain
MIARVWRGVVSRDHSNAYAAYVEATGVAAYEKTPGCLVATILVRDIAGLTESGGATGARVEVVALSVWDSEDHIRAFAGPNIEEMVLYPEDDQYLLEPPTLTHHHVTQVARPSQETTITTEEVARSFSGHRFEETFDHIAEEAVWHLVGQARLEGRDAIIKACRATAAENAETDTTWLRFVSAGTGAVVAVDAIGRYTGPSDTVSTVSSCDIYEFDGDMMVAIISYAVELATDDPAAVSG